MDANSLSPDVREMWDEFVEKQDEPQYMRNVLSGLSGIMLVGRAHLICRDAYLQRQLLVLLSVLSRPFSSSCVCLQHTIIALEAAVESLQPDSCCFVHSVRECNDRFRINSNIETVLILTDTGDIGHEFRLCSKQRYEDKSHPSYFVGCVLGPRMLWELDSPTSTQPLLRSPMRVRRLKRVTGEAERE